MNHLLLALAKYIAAWLASVVALWLYAGVCIFAGFSMPMVLILASCVSVSAWCVMTWILN